MGSLIENSIGPPRKAAMHLGFLDGLRGLAAFYVLLFHLHGLFLTDHRAKMSRPVLILSSWMGHGHYAVAVFIVLSGFCLMLPVASPSNTSQRLRGGVGQYLLRRAKRILPPYYAALIISLFLAFNLKEIVQILQGHPPIVAQNVLAHFLLLHNLHKDWSATIDPPLWSVATEWQIYFMLPLLLLPVWRRFGIFASVVVAFLVGLAPHFLLPSAWNYDWACPWYLGLFALGMLGAVIANATSGRLRSLYLRAPWPWLLLISAAICLIVLFSHRAEAGASNTGAFWILDTFIGIATVCLILSCAIQSHTVARPSETAISETAIIEATETPLASGATALSAKRRPLLLTILESRAAILLGGFSYSLYLLHQPLCYTVIFQVSRLPFSANVMWLILLCAGIPILLLVCYLFHLIFERPWMQSSYKPK